MLVQSCNIEMTKDDYKAIDDSVDKKIVDTNIDLPFSKDSVLFPYFKKFIAVTGYKIFYLHRNINIDHLQPRDFEKKFVIEEYIKKCTEGVEAFLAIFQEQYNTFDQKIQSYKVYKCDCFDEIVNDNNINNDSINNDNNNNSSFHHSMFNDNIYHDIIHHDSISICDVNSDTSSESSSNISYDMDIVNDMCISVNDIIIDINNNDSNNDMCISVNDSKNDSNNNDSNNNDSNNNDSNSNNNDSHNNDSNRICNHRCDYSQHQICTLCAHEMTDKTIILPCCKNPIHKECLFVQLLFYKPSCPFCRAII
jgi:hypothetical protein